MTASISSCSPPHRRGEVAVGSSHPRARSRSVAARQSSSVHPRYGWIVSGDAPLAAIRVTCASHGSTPSSRRRGDVPVTAVLPQAGSSRATARGAARSATRARRWRRTAARGGIAPVDRARREVRGLQHRVPSRRRRRRVLAARSSIPRVGQCDRVRRSHQVHTDGSARATKVGANPWNTAVTIPGPTGPSGPARPAK